MLIVYDVRKMTVIISHVRKNDVNGPVLSNSTILIDR